MSFVIFMLCHMRLVILSLVLAALQVPMPTPSKVGKPPQNQSSARQQPTDTEQRGTEQSPLVVKTLETAKSQAEIEQESEDRKQKATNDGRIVILTGVLALVAIGQLGVYLYQAIKLRETVKAAGDQSAAMDRHIGEAARSATAMERIAATIQTGNRAIMRAYLTVNIGTGDFQQRNRVGQTDVKFAVYPTVVNTGNTHARHVRIRKKAAFFPSLLPQNFAYEELGAGNGRPTRYGCCPSELYNPSCRG
jgi:hypothetical protein